MILLSVDNRRISIVHVFSPVEDVVDEDGYEIMDIANRNDSYIKLVFDDGEDLIVDDLVMYGSLGDNRGSRPVAYLYDSVVYLSETRQDVKLQVMT